MLWLICIATSAFGLGTIMSLPYLVYSLISLQTNIGLTHGISKAQIWWKCFKILAETFGGWCPNLFNKLLWNKIDMPTSPRYIQLLIFLYLFCIFFIIDSLLLQLLGIWILWNPVSSHDNPNIFVSPSTVFRYYKT